MFVGNNNYNNYNNLNGNNNLNNNGRFVGITLPCQDFLMKAYKNLWNKLCSYENLELAFRRARKHKTLKLYVMEFEKNLEENLLQLRAELLLHSYRPKPLETFILCDPKTRKISKSDFRDRIIHHALCNIIEPIFEKTFIYDSYANRIGKGTLKAIQRFDYFKRGVSRNNTGECFILKADIRHYFETVDHGVLMGIIKRKIKDKDIIWLVKTILSNYNSKGKGKGMPLGNLTSQFFANVYLDALDRFVKHNLKAKYYIRYVDDFVIFENAITKLKHYKEKISEFLKTIKLELHPDKSSIISLEQGVCFLGFRIFYCCRLLKKSNIRKMKRKLAGFKMKFDGSNASYDKIYSSMEGWLAYASNGNTHKLRKSFAGEFECIFPGKMADVEIDRWTRHAKNLQVGIL